MTLSTNRILNKSDFLSGISNSKFRPQKLFIGVILQLSSATAICQKMTEEIKRTAKNDRSKDKTVLWFVILKAIINKINDTYLLNLPTVFFSRLYFSSKSKNAESTCQMASVQIFLEES